MTEQSDLAEELAAMRVVAEALAGLKLESRARVLWWAGDRFLGDISPVVREAYDRAYEFAKREIRQDR